jgi:hypothetical protein
LFPLRPITGWEQFRTSGMKRGQKLATESFPNNALNNGTTMASMIECAHLCNKYLYCTTFSYNDGTKECRFVVGMNSTSHPAALAVQKMLKQFIHVFVILQADSGWNTYDIVEL